MAEVQTTTLNRGWVLKMGMFLLVAAVIGSWGLLDASVFYPRSGEADASFRLRNYLQRAKDVGRLTQTKVTEPRKDLAELTARKAELASKSGETSMSGRIAAMELAKLEWLESLSRLWRLDSAPTRIADPEAQLKKLTDEWKTKSTPTPLSEHDILFQWIITSLGFLLAVAVLAVLLRAKMKRFTWDEGEKRLTLPDGSAFTPAEVREFDKRKWHKFFVTVVLNDGRNIKLDLLRHSPLEEWILEMERIAFPESAPADKEPTDGPVPAA